MTSTALSPAPAALDAWAPDARVGYVVRLDGHEAHTRITVGAGQIDIEGVGAFEIIDEVRVAELRGAHAAGRAGQV